MKLYAYNNGSKSAKSLADALGIKRIKHEGKRLVVKDSVINWGASAFTRDVVCNNIINRPEAVALAVNKLKTFNSLDKGVPVPPWTTKREEALQWLGDGFTVVSRTKLTGHSGEGIFIKGPGDQGIIEEAPLYTQYVPKKQEYRLHVFRDAVFFVQRKARNRDVPDDKVNWNIRNHGNGFIFAHIDVDVPDVAKEAAIMAVKSLGLDFGAVDLMWSKARDKYYVLEVNTACGLEGTTLQKYTEVFQELM